MKEFRFIFEEKDIHKIAEEFLKVINGNRHIAFYGGMGVGKTTFITALCNQLKTPDLVSSPTFAIINEYMSEDGTSIYHFDFYRIKNTEELLDIGFYEYCNDQSYCFIEWPEKAQDIIPDDFIHVDILEDNKGKRKLIFQI